MSIRIDDNTIYLIQSFLREKTKLYIQNLKCEKDVFIIEDHLGDDTSYYKYKYLINDKLYGNYIIKNYSSIIDLDFEKFDKENEEVITNFKNRITGLVNVYTLKCVTPSAFYLEIFSGSDFPSYMDPGDNIRTVLYTDYYYRYMFFYYLNPNYIYKVHIQILDIDITMNRTLRCQFHYLKQNYFVDIKEPNNYYNETYYEDLSDPYFPYFAIKSNKFMYINYYLASNHLFHNIIEGKIKVDKNNPNLALKVKNDIYFDYIKIEAKSFENIVGKYELKLISSENIEKESNAVMVGLPQVRLPSSTFVLLNISNPYNKFDPISYIDKADYNFYLLFSFEIGHDNSIYLDIEYIHNESSIRLTSIDSRIISPQTEYEYFFSNVNYKKKDKVIFNINKCNNLTNYTLINYFENDKNIIKETLINESHQAILIDNFYFKGKIILIKESEKVEELNNSLIYPANYYYKGDILLNYFLIQSSELKGIKFTSDYRISYDDDTWNNITFKWNQYAYKESNNNNKINIPTNYSIYILPKNSVVNTICQLYLIPSNKSIINSTSFALELKEGQYKILIIAKIIEEEFPFEIMYEKLEINIVKRINVALIVILTVLGIFFILFILFLIFWKKKLFIFKKRGISPINGDDDVYESMIKGDYEEEEEDEESRKNSLAKKLIEMIDK